MLQQNLCWPVDRTELCLSSSAGCSLSARERGAVQEVCEQRLQLGESQGLFDCGCSWKSCATAHEDSVCDHILLQSLWSEMGCLGHWATQMFCTVIRQKKRVKKGYNCVYVKSDQAGIFSHWGCVVLVLHPESGKINGLAYLWVQWGDL